jgi:hypothetical protein
VVVVVVVMVVSWLLLSLLVAAPPPSGGCGMQGIPLRKQREQGRLPSLVVCVRARVYVASV